MKLSLGRFLPDFNWRTKLREAIHHHSLEDYRTPKGIVPFEIRGEEWTLIVFPNAGITVNAAGGQPRRYNAPIVPWHMRRKRERERSGVRYSAQARPCLKPPLRI